MNIIKPTRKEKKYDGLYLSCYMDFIEDDIALKLWKGVAA